MKVFIRTTRGVLSLIIGFFILPCFCFSQGKPDYPINPDPAHYRYKMSEYEQLDAYAGLVIALNAGMPQISAEVMVERKDEEGNITVYFQGKPYFSLAKNGDTTLFISRGQKNATVHVNGVRMRNYTWGKGEEQAGRAVVLNEFGEVLGFEQHSARGIEARFDSSNRLTHIYEHDQAGNGYWEYSLADKLWKRYELNRPVKEFRGAKTGPLAAYWHQDAEAFWRVEMTSIVCGKDNNGLPVYTIGEGDRYKYADRYGTELIEVYDNLGNLKIRNKWRNFRLARVENRFAAEYSDYGDYGVVDEGVIFYGQNEEAGVWEYEWKGSRKIAAQQVLYHPLDGKPRYSGKYIEYDLDGNIKETGWIVNDNNLDKLNTAAKVDGVDEFSIGDKIVGQKYVYFYEVKDLSKDEIREFFHAGKNDAEFIYLCVQELKDTDREKADIGLFAIATFGLPEDSKEYLAQVVTFDEFNNTRFSKQSFDPAAGAGFKQRLAQEYLEYGEYEQCLMFCEEFERTYMGDLANIDLDSKLGRFYFKVLNIKQQALDKLGRGDEAGAVGEFMIENFGSLEFANNS